MKINNLTAPFLWKLNLPEKGPSLLQVMEVRMI